ncbi:hypothetical protein, partial [Helicobacter typhlonius]|uniref:hypothetical protein n=1 Tax=Helicobacter typhlonius TaxID=76936 RepID=UPI002FDF8C67
KMPKTHMPTLKAINDSNLYQAKLLDEARKNAVGAEILDTHEVLIHTCKTIKEVESEALNKKALKDVSWEAAVLKRGDK